MLGRDAVVFFSLDASAERSSFPFRRRSCNTRYLPEA
jgi:hypothetical protein